MNRREIKFRAWNRKLKIIRQVLVLEMEPKEYPQFSTRIGKYLVFDHPCVVSALIKSRFSKWDEPDCELLQFTGLKDKNGKEIYEGDIVSYRGYRGVVGLSFLKGAHISSYHPESEAFDDGKEYKLEEGMRGERTGCPVGVIGNVYENPELLEAK